MTIYDLRKTIMIKSFANDLTGVTIEYTICNESKLLTCGLEPLYSELNAIGSIESKTELLDGYKISQWDALNLVIRHEYANYMESEASDIFEALANITKPNK